MDMGTRDLEQDESLGLNSTWYADILLTLTAPESLVETQEAQQEMPAAPEEMEEK